MEDRGVFMLCLMYTGLVAGLPAMEVHLCGDQSAIDLVRRLAHSSGEEIEVRIKWGWVRVATHSNELFMGSTYSYS